ncbi:MAG: hypothetical protein HC930_05165 [Hydrococcus sp. SU_1_0]|nr:hypothetical protein [Hydrococcus sp. SU_1_0]
MLEKKLITIQDSIGYSLRGIRAQKDYIEYLIKYEKKDLSVIILAHPIFREVAEETFARTGAIITFESYKNGIIDNKIVAKTASKYSVKPSDIINEAESILCFQKIFKENYSIVFDNLGQPHPNPHKPSLYVREKTIQEIKNQLKDVAIRAKVTTKSHDAKVIFLPFSGLKAFGTDYGKTEDEKHNLAKFMSFPFEDSIPAIRHIQKELEKHNIIVVPIPIQYGNLVEIHKTIFNLSQQYNLNPMPTSLDIDWNKDLAQQVGFFHAINQWSQQTGLPNIAIVHGSACLHLVEECAEPQNMIAFYATHTEKIKLEDDGRVYHLAVAEQSGGWLRAIMPPIPNSHNYKLVAHQITEQASKAILENFYPAFSNHCLTS